MGRFFQHLFRPHWNHIWLDLGIHARFNLTCSLLIRSTLTYQALWISASSPPHPTSPQPNIIIKQYYYLLYYWYYSLSFAIIHALLISASIYLGRFWLYSICFIDLKFSWRLWWVTWFCLQEWINRSIMGWFYEGSLNEMIEVN